MPCCGKNRVPDGWNQGGRGGRTPQPLVMPSAIYFRNSGPSSITVWAPNSGRMYRFPSSGLAVAVDANDVASISSVPHLIRHSLGAKNGTHHR